MRVIAAALAWLQMVLFTASGFVASDSVHRVQDIYDPVATAFERHPGADPWYYAYDGKYYYCYASGEGVGVKTADSIAGLYEAEHHQVFEAPRDTPYTHSWWAPELHCIDGVWYIYVAADDGNNETHRMYVLRSDDPVGSYTFCGKVSSPDDHWAIDGTVFEFGGDLYMIWSGWEDDPDAGQNLYIAGMSDPLTISTERVCISRPERKWERKGAPINEGPEVLTTDKGLFVIYPASGSWTDDYCLGMLRLIGDDPMCGDAWRKCPLPVFSGRKGAYGPGHGSFVTDFETGARYLVYHANEESGTGWYGRSIRLQKFRVVCGVPVFGRPVTGSRLFES